MAVAKELIRVEVLKTYKLYIGGQFPRTESGRYYSPVNKKGKKLANMCLSSRKDIREAVVAARNAFSGWSSRAAFNKSQILYRIAEMLESRKAQFIEELQLQDYTLAQARNEVNLSIDRLIYYAGWCDKYQAVTSSVNPVTGPYFNFSVPEPMGVIAVIAPQQSALLGLISTIVPAIAGGNTCIVLAAEKMPLTAITLAEVINSSDVPAGVVNILTGSNEELLPWIAGHMDINATIYAEKDSLYRQLLQEKGANNLKRIFFYDHINWEKEEGASLYFITDLQEIKTTWHPVESIAGGGGKY